MAEDEQMRIKRGRYPRVQPISADVAETRGTCLVHVRKGGDGSSGSFSLLVMLLPHGKLVIVEP